MIVLSNKEGATETVVEKSHKESFEDMFRRELDAYCTYKEWCEETSDEILQMALDEIMIDEFLHAKFLRDYMIENDMYTLLDSDPYERKYWKIQRRMFKG